jgi:hypothetical protein
MVLLLLTTTGACAGDQAPQFASTGAAEIGLAPGAVSADPDEQAFLAASTPVANPGDDLIVVQRSETGAVRMVFGPGFKVPLTGIGCAAGDIGEGARCFLRHFQQAFRLSDPDSELVLLRVREEPYGDTVALFNQQYLGYPVFGRQVLVTVTPSGDVTHVYSTLAVPLTGPDTDAVKLALSGANPRTSLAAAQAYARDNRLTAGPAMELVWPTLVGGTFVAIHRGRRQLDRPGVEITRGVTSGS